VNDPTICAIIGPYNSGVAAALAPLAIKYKMPFMVTNAVADQTLSENSRYVFRANHGDVDCYNHYINALKYFGEVRGKPLARIAIVFENTDFGKGTSDVFARAVNAIGATVIMNESFQSESSDLSSVVTKIKQLNPDLVLPAMYLNDALLFTRQMMEYDCNVPIVAQGGGFLAVDFPQKAGKKLSQYLIVGSGWFPDVIDAAKTQEAKDIRAAYIKSSGHDMNEAVSFGWLGMYVLLDAIQRAGSTNREAIAQALDATDLPADHPALMFHAYGGIKFGDDGKRFNQNVYAAFMFAQMFNGQFKMVYPPEMIVGKNPLVFPPPNWDKR
jgi:branched-chain amino acid transport system substrate-binding protein